MPLNIDPPPRQGKLPEPDAETDGIYEVETNKRKQEK